MLRAVTALIATAGLLASATPAHAYALNDANVHNAGPLGIAVCRDAASDTACAGTSRWLNPGENARRKFGWPDTDLWYRPARTRLVGQTGCATTSRWIKVSGLLGSTYTVRLERC